MKPQGNLIVVFEEEPGSNITSTEILTVDRDTICGHSTEHHPPSVKVFARKGSQLVIPEKEDAKPSAHLTCPDNKEIVVVEFADFGDPWGACGSYFSGNCTSPVTKGIVEKVSEILGLCTCLP